MGHQNLEHHSLPYYDVQMWSIKLRSVENHFVSTYQSIAITTRNADNILKDFEFIASNEKKQNSINHQV